ncbi:unnamed protein product [Amoebophrya sp. A120]|nr:unnamed protein product [Amoebophrya sp. A120]|eukprot:GSA120T00025201001.1
MIGDEVERNGAFTSLKMKYFHSATQGRGRRAGTT